MYDVVYLDRNGIRETVATHLERDAACDLARTEARRRSVGRMFLAGSELPAQGGLILIVHEAEASVRAA
jgi:hypothetical protein